MKKIKYLTYGVIGSVSVTGVAVSAEDDRLYGMPSSLSHQPDVLVTPLRLSLSANKIPRELWSDIEELSLLWSEMATPQYRIKRYLDDFDSSNLSQMSKKKLSKSAEYSALEAISSPYMLSMIEIGDYQGVLTELDKLGLWKSDDEASIQNKIERILSTDIQSRQELSKQLSDMNSMSDAEKVLFLQQHIKPVIEGRAVVGAAVVAVVVVAVATYVAAAVNVAAAGNIVAYTSVVVNAAVSVQGNVGVGGQNSCGNCHKESRSINYSRLSEEAASNHNMMNTLAMIHNNERILSIAEIDFHKKEARAVLNAAINIGLVTIDSDMKQQVFEVLDDIVESNLAL